MSRTHAAAPEPGTMRDRSGEPTDGLRTLSYPLSAMCIECCAPISLRDSLRDWVHVDEPAAGAVIVLALMQSGPDVRYAGPATGARDAARLRRDLADTLRAMGLEGMWQVKADPPPRGRKGWTLWLHRDPSASNPDVAVKLRYWASCNQDLITRVTAGGLIGEVITRYLGSGRTAG